MKKDLKKKQQHQAAKVKKVKRDFAFYLPYIVIVALTFIIYGNSISNDYALDDAIVITQNVYTQKGLDGIGDILTTEGFTGFFGTKKNLVAGGRYRPLSIVTFAIEYQFFKQNPHLSHFINVLLYALTGILVYIILKRLLSKYNNTKWYFSLPFIATAIFIVHPIHTEVVANIKGRDEILSLLGSLLSMLTIIKYLESNKIKYLVYSSIYFFLGLMSKENTITFLAIIPLSIYYFTKYDIKKNLTALIPIGISTLLYMLIRQSILGSLTADIAKELMNNPFLNATISQKFATIFYTLWVYIKLLFVPYPLTFDYYPYHIQLIEWSNIRAFLPLILYLALIIIAVIGFKKKSLISYSILLYIITLSIASNFVLPVGTFMNERFVYASSLGYALILAFLLADLLPKYIKNKSTYNLTFYSLLIIILVSYSARTIARNTNWKNDFTLFTHDVKISGNSAKSTCSAGGKLIEEAQTLKAQAEKEPSMKQQLLSQADEYLKLSMHYLHRSITIYPKYLNALLLMGNAHYEYNKRIDSTLFYYKKILDYDPNYNLVYGNIAKIFNTTDDFKFKIKAYEELSKYNPNVYEINYGLGSLYGKYMNNIPLSIQFLEKAISIKPTAEAYKDLAVAYAYSGRFEESIKYSENAFALNQNDSQVLINIGMCYKQLGNEAKSSEYFKRAQEIDQSTAKTK